MSNLIERHKWDRHIGGQGGAYKTALYESKMKPNQQPMVREVRLQGEIVCGSTNAYDGEDIITYGEYVDVLSARMQHAHEVARKHMSSAVKMSKELYDTKVAFHRYNEGDVVLCLMEARKLGCHQS